MDIIETLESIIDNKCIIEYLNKTFNDELSGDFKFRSGDKFRSGYFKFSYNDFYENILNLSNKIKSQNFRVIEIFDLLESLKHSVIICKGIKFCIDNFGFDESHEFTLQELIDLLTTSIDKFELDLVMKNAVKNKIYKPKKKGIL